MKGSIGRRRCPGRMAPKGTDQRPARRFGQALFPDVPLPGGQHGDARRDLFSITKGAYSLRTRLLRISAIPEQSLANRHQFSPSDSSKRSRNWSGNRPPNLPSIPDETQHHASATMGKAFDGRVARQRRSDDEAEQGDYGEYSAEPKISATLASIGPRGTEQQGMAKDAADEGRDGVVEGVPPLPRPCFLPRVAVPRQVTAWVPRARDVFEQDRCGPGAAIWALGNRCRRA